VNGRAASFGPSNALLTKLPTMLEAWRPGEEGADALVDILTGAANPSGKLTSQWAQNVGQMGSGAQPWLARRVGKWLANGRSQPDPDGREYDPYIATAYPSTPLFRFGHGLSYTTFQYQALNVSVVNATWVGAPITGRAAYAAAFTSPVLIASVEVCNTGQRDGTEVVQVYSIDPAGVVSTGTLLAPYWKRLVGYGRIFLHAGDCGVANIPVTADDLALYDGGDGGSGVGGGSGVLRVWAGDYRISAGGRSDLDTLHVNVTLTSALPSGARAPGPAGRDRLLAAMGARGA